jgi:outer membrane lipoprotein SlyB
MTKLLIWIGLFVGSWIGWFLGGLIGGFGWAFFISCIGSIAGIVMGWKIANNLF